MPAVDANGVTLHVQEAGAAAVILGARVHVIDGAGPLPHVEAPQALAAILAPFPEVHAND